MHASHTSLVELALPPCCGCRLKALYTGSWVVMLLLLLLVVLMVVPRSEIEAVTAEITDLFRQAEKVATEVAKQNGQESDSELRVRRTRQRRTTDVA